MTGGTFTGNTFASNGGDGLSYSGYSVITRYTQPVAPVIANNTFSDNGAWAAQVFADVLSPSLDTNTGTGNTYNAIGLSGTIVQNWTWSLAGLLYVIENQSSDYQSGPYGVVVASGATLTVPAGFVVKAGDDPDQGCGGDVPADGGRHAGDTGHGVKPGRVHVVSGRQLRRGYER